MVLKSAPEFLVRLESSGDLDAGPGVGCAEEYSSTASFSARSLAMSSLGLLCTNNPRGILGRYRVLFRGFLSTG